MAKRSNEPGHSSQSPAHIDQLESPNNKPLSQSNVPSKHWKYHWVIITNGQVFSKEQLEGILSEIRLRAGPVALFKTDDELYLVFHCTSSTLNRLREHFPDIQDITDSSQKEVTDWLFRQTFEDQ